VLAVALALQLRGEAERIEPGLTELLSAIVQYVSRTL
jgi:hypothetical protein